jgi:hypothetical protein
LQFMRWMTHVSSGGGERACGWICPDGRGLDGRASLVNAGCDMAPSRTHMITASVVR